MTAVRERPILFSAPMVRALLSGAKTQTRRIVKLPPAPNHLGQWEPFWFGGEGCRDSRGNLVSGRWTISHTRTGAVLGCPHGDAGDRLWVRETWRADDLVPNDATRTIYRADADSETTKGIAGIVKFRPSIFMPRNRSRILLEITDVRVQRLQEISEADALAEGIGRENVMTSCYYANGHREVHEDRYFYPSCREEGFDEAGEAFAHLWDSINAARDPKHIRRRREKGKPVDRPTPTPGPYAWAANPWVWAISFKQVSP